MTAADARIVVEQNGAVVFAGAAEVLIGSRTGCDVVVDDPIVADRHCRIGWDGAFTVRDLGSVTGTWVDGKPAGAATPLATGSVVVLGATQLIATVVGTGDAARLRLDLQRQSFWWTKPGKGTFDNDPDAMVRAEVDFGRFPALRLLNRVAAVAAFVLLVGAVCIGAVFEPLADPGPLLPAHAQLQRATIAAADPHAAARIAAEQGCHACHEPHQGTTATKCLQCHGDLAAAGSWRHPWLGDGELASLPGHTVDEAFCGVCHRDHEGADHLRPEARALVGDCASCHQVDRATLVEQAPLPRLEPRQRAIAAHAFPHDAHLTAGVPCGVCHTIPAEVRSARGRGDADDPDRGDFAAVPFATCAACHVPDAAPLPDVAADDRARWRAKDHQWPVTWHGTDDGGKGCRQCHSAVARDGVTAFGPELRPVERPALTVDEHAAERARYDVDRRLHAEEFAAHAGPFGCGTCHLRAAVTPGARPARPFWHALHLAAAALQPTADTAAGVSLDERGGCLSCHGDQRQATTLLAADKGAFAWPSDPAAAAACRTCHADGPREVVLRAVPTPIPPERRRTVADFPHAAHVAAAAFGAPGASLADGCFSCHAFTTPGNGDRLQAVPTVLDGVADCTRCHGGHRDIGGGACQHCHPATAGRSNSFWVAARLPAGSQVAGRTVPAPATRAWPPRNGFSHLSPGHSGDGLDGKPLTCASCHDERATAAAATLDGVPVPDETAPLCRDCHLQRQFHWR
jgi:hypothetical protein